MSFFCNFSDVFKGKTQLQFGRVGSDEFSLDYSHPFSGLQAFAVAVSNLTTKTFLDSW